MGNRQRSQGMVGHPQITNPETIRPSTPFLVESYTPGEPEVKTVMVGIFITRPFSDDQGRVVQARVREGGKQKIEVRTLRLGLDFGFYDQAHRRVYRLPRTPF